jgi:mono/diheme cytochrome c family protein
MRLARVPAVLFFMLILAGCGTPAPLAVTLVPTSVLPTRVPVEVAKSGEATTAPTTIAAAATKAPTLAPTTAPTKAAIQPTATFTLIPTKGPPTLNPAAERGKALFQAGIGEEGVPTCASCHYVDKAEPFTGPSLVGVATRAARRVPGQDAVTYLRNSIINPNAFLVPNEKDKDGIDHIYAAGGQSLMYQQFQTKLKPEQIGDLVAYLVTLK